MKKTKHNQTLSPEQYIRQKARTLPLGQCYMNKNWFISGIGIAVVCRRHKMDTYTFGVFQLDTFCTGLVECKIEFSRDKESYNNIMAYLQNTFKIEPVTYQEVHNLIYGGVAFGEDAGFTPPTNYHLAQFLLEEDTEEIPLINYQFGRAGKHFLWAESVQELDEFMPHLIHHLGAENVLFGLVGSDQCFNGEDFYDSKTRAAMMKLASKIRHSQKVDLEEYSYVHPAYPAELKVKHQEVCDMLYDEANYLKLSNDQIQSVLALPHDELRADLEQILLYETGKTCDELPALSIENRNSVLLHCIILLGELGYKESLPVVLETLSQNKRYYDYHFGILLNETYVPTLYQLGKDQLDVLFSYLQTPGLYTYARYLVFPIMVQIVEHEPERRAEVIEWFRKVLNFYADKLEKNVCCDGALVGLFTTDLVKLKAEELLPELKVLFETGKVNVECCGEYDKVVEMMKESNPFSINYQFNIFDHYNELANNLNQITEANANILRTLDEELKAEEEDAKVAEESVQAEVEAVEAEEVNDDEMQMVQNAETDAKPEVQDAEIIEEVTEETAEEEKKVKGTTKKAATAKPTKKTTKSTVKAADSEEKGAKAPKKTVKKTAKKATEKKEEKAPAKTAKTPKKTTKAATAKKAAGSKAKTTKSEA